MGQDLDIRQFFRRAPHLSLSRYFSQRGHLADFDWPSLSTKKGVNDLQERWLAINADERGPILRDFTEISLLATPVGKTQILDEAEFHESTEEIRAGLATLPGFHECAFWVFFEHRKCWDGAVFYALADGKSKRYWRKRINMPVLGRLPTDADGEALAAAVAEVFRKHESRGDNCVVHQFRRGAKGDREYYFAYPQDHNQTAIEYDKGEMTKRPHNPAFEVIFIHDDTQRTLSIWHEGVMDRIKDLQAAFATAVLGTTIPRESPRDNRVYDLQRLLDPTFVFKSMPELRIASVEVRKMTVRIIGPTTHKISVELADDCPGYVLIDRINAATQRIPKTLIKVARIGIRATFEIEQNEKHARRRSFEVSWPNSCSLANDSYGTLLQRMLVEHSIEPRSPLSEANHGVDVD